MRSARPGAVVATVAEVLDRLAAGDRHASRTAFMVDEISKWCAAYFDEGQAAWRMPSRGLPPYAAWRASMRHDRNPETMGIRGFRAAIAGLPAEPRAAIAAVVERLGIPARAVEDYLHRALFDIGGWAAYARYLVWDNELDGRADDTLVELLAIRLSWGYALFLERAGLGVQGGLAAGDGSGRHAARRRAARRRCRSGGRSGPAARLRGRLPAAAAGTPGGQHDGRCRSDPSRPQAAAGRLLHRRALRGLPAGAGDRLPGRRDDRLRRLLRLPHRVYPDRPGTRRRPVPGAAEPDLHRLRGRRPRLARRGDRDPGPAAAAPAGRQGLEVLQALRRLVFRLRRDAGPELRRQAPERQPGLTRPVKDPNVDGLDKRVIDRIGPRLDPREVGGRATGFDAEQRSGHGRRRAARHVDDRGLRAAGRAVRARQQRRSTTRTPRASIAAPAAATPARPMRAWPPRC